MTKGKSTTRTLIASVLSLFLCISMFVGMTFAWFTDSVSSGNNKIQAGNLDVVLEYSKTLEQNSWQEITNRTEDIFTDLDGNEILWEPGAASVVYLKIKNAGTLALKYNLGINIVNELAGTNELGNPFTLSNYIKFSVVELNANDSKYETREEAIAAITTSNTIKDGYTYEESMLAGEEKIIALILHMPEGVGEEANYKTGTEAPEINMGISLVATQASYESDGFNKTYDSSAAYKAVSTTVVAGEETVLKLGSFAEIVVPTNAKAGGDNLENGDVLTFALEPSTEAPIGYTITTGSGTFIYDISVSDQNGEKVTDTANGIVVKLFIGESEATSVKHIVNGVEEDVPFTIEGQYIKFTTSSFSPFVITSKYVAKIGNEKYESLQEALNNALNGEKITLLSNIMYENCNDSPLKYQAQDNNISAVLDLNGKTVSATLNNGKSIALLKVGNINADRHAGTATMTIKDSSENMSGTLTVMPTVASSAWDVAVETIVVERLGRLTVDSGNIITTGGNANADNPYGILVLTNTGAQTAELTINGGYIESKSSTGMGVRVAANSEKAPVIFTMNGGTIVGAEDGRGVWLHHMAGSGRHQLIECTFNNGTIKADRAIEVGDFNKDTDVSDNIKVVFNGGTFVSTNIPENPVHSEVSELFSSKSVEYYNTTFTHVHVTDNR